MKISGYVCMDKTMEFSPFNPIVKLCLQGMEMANKGLPDEALKLFLQGWHEASNDFEKFLPAYYIAQQQHNVSDKLNWLEKTLELALKNDDVSVKSALPALYFNIAKCYLDLGDPENAEKHKALGHLHNDNPADKGPFYHGTKADLQPGDLLVAGGLSNYKDALTMNHIYFTALVNGAGLAAALAQGEGRERVYVIVPTGSFENDPNLTDKKFPGNPTRSYRSLAPLKIVGEVTEWVKPSEDDLQRFRDKLAASNGEIIN